MLTLSYIALAVWAFALANIIINLLVLGRLRGAGPERCPLVSIIVPARNEERAIERTVLAFLAQDYSDFEVIVVDDRSSDATGAILDRIAPSDPRLIVVHGDEPPDGWLGKPWAMHEGSQRARGELLLFVDADVDYAPGALAAAVGHMQASGDDMTFLFPHFEMRGFWENAVMPILPMSPFSFPLWLGERFPMTWLGVGGGTGNLIRRTAYDAVDGFAALRDAVIDDVGLAHHVRRSGFRTGLARTDRFISVRMYHGLGEIVRGFTKNLFTALGRSYAAVAIVLVFFAVLHLLPYPFALMGIRPAMATLGLIVLSRVVFFTALRYPLWSAILLHPFATLAWLWITLRSTWLTGIRGKLAWRGRTYDTSRTRFGAKR